jgi:chromosome segregation ATPase
MATKSLSAIVTENHLRSEIDILTKDLQSKDAVIKKHEQLIERLQDDAALKRRALDAQASEAAKSFSTAEAQAREIARLQAQLAQTRSKLLDETHDHDLDTKDLQYQLDTQRKRHDRDIQELRSEGLAERKKRDIQLSAQMELELANQKATLAEKNQALSALVASLRAHVQDLENTEYDLRYALSTADRDMRTLRVELRRAQGGTPLVTDVVIPNPIEKTIHGLERKVDRLKGNVISQTEELTKATTDKSDFKSRCRELQLELDDAQRAKTRLELDKVDIERRLGRKIEDLEAKLAQKAKDAKDRDLAVQKVHRTKTAVEEKTSEVSSLQDQVAHLQDELSFAKSKFDKVTEKQREELSEERAKVERLEIKIHTLESELDSEKRKTAAAKASHKQAEDQIRKLKDAQLRSDKDSDKLASRVAKLEKNLRDMERATMKI